MKIIDLQKGLTFHRTSKDSVFYSDLKRILDFSGVPFIDPCCTTDLVGLPVRINRESDNRLEYFDGSVWTSYTNLPMNNVILNSITELTVGSGVVIDGALVKDGGISANSMFAGFFPTTAAQALSGAGAVNVTSFLTKFTSSGVAQALTIASGTQIGQRKKVSHVVDGGSGVLTGVFVGGTTITFTTAGEYCELMWTGSAWAVLSLENSVTPGTPPVLA